jgi:regulator of nucleoside diphosphate kinase
MKHPLIPADDFRRLKAMIRHAAPSRPPAAHPDALERELRRATLVTPRRVPKDVVTMNSRVRVRDLDGGPARIVTVAYPHHLRRGGGRGVSVLAPMGAALLGKRVGDVAFPRGGDGTRAARIEQVLYQPKTTGDLHL